jgi:serine/threonine-protein kinase
MDKIGRYEIIEELGRGTMGAVFKARDPNIGRIVAIKVILTANLSAEELVIYKQRFYREAQAAGRMLHPGIIAIHDIQEDGQGQPYLVMEYAEGNSLHKLLKPNPLGKLPDRFPLKKSLELAAQVADALDYAHAHGVVHRDIKPSNIIVTPEGRAKIADFGIARLEGTEATHTSSITGTPAYMSPEQFKGGTIDKRSDIFSLGAMLYWMTTGHKPFPGESLSQVSFMVVYKEPIPPLEHDPALPPDVAAVLARCLAKNPDDRYPVARQLVADLHAIAEGKPLAGRPHAAKEHLEETVVNAPRPVVAAAPEAAAKHAAPVAAKPAGSKPAAVKATAPVAVAAKAAAAHRARTGPALWTRLTEGHSKGLSATLGVVLVVVLGIGLMTMMRPDAPPPPQQAAAPAGSNAAATPADTGAPPPAAADGSAAPPAGGHQPPADAGSSGGADTTQPPPPPPGEGSGAAPAPTKTNPVRRPTASAGGTTSGPAPQEQKVAAASSAAAPSAGPAPPPPPASGPEPAKTEPARPEPAATRASSPSTTSPAPGSGPRGATARLEIECKHNFKQASIEILEGTRALYSGELIGKSGMFGRESGTLKHTAAIRPGKRTLTVRVKSAEARYEDEKQIEGEFADGETLKLEIGFPRGGGIGIGGRKMNLAWKK